MPEDFEQDDFEEPPSFFPRELNGRSLSGEPVKVEVEGVYSHEESGTIHRYVRLLDSNGRELPIAIGPFEAMAIHIALSGASITRPLTHDLLKLVIEKMDGILDRAVIDDLWNSTYYAKLYVVADGQELEIDCRPSDAIAVALRMEAPIYVIDSILEAYNEEN
ncbi:MAG: bifunctional nuclease family protein [Fimbriimonadales bacterium]|nr:bifunctional nuclease family protein [Fimbriimonadales bacterium]